MAEEHILNAGDIMKSLLLKKGFHPLHYWYGYSL